MRYLLPMLAIALFNIIPAFAAGSIQCEEYDPDEYVGDPVKARFEIALDEKGKAQSVSAKRVATEDMPSLDWNFTAKNSGIRHEIEKNSIEMIDPGTKEITYWFNIENVETIEVTGSDGRSLKIVINDHRYSGTPGSSVFYNDQKSYYNMNCKGSVKFPMSSPAGE